MFIQVNTGNELKRSANLSARVIDLVEAELQRFEDHITGIEVHLGDENADKGGARDKRCMIEVRLKGARTIAVTSLDSTVEDAIATATGKMVRSLDRRLGRWRASRQVGG